MEVKFTDEQLQQLRNVLREQFDRAGLRLDEPEHVDDAREDFRFLRKIRKFNDGIAPRIGTFVIISGLGLLGWAITTAANVWKSAPTP